jgi:hypothetical protein
MDDDEEADEIMMEGRDLRFLAHFPATASDTSITPVDFLRTWNPYLDTNTAEAVLSSGSGVFFDPDIENGTRNSLVSFREFKISATLNLP